MSSFFSDPDGIKMFVLDEADEMLSRGFKDQIYDIFTKLPTDIQVAVVYLYFGTSDVHVTSSVDQEERNFIVPPQGTLHVTAASRTANSQGHCKNTKSLSGETNIYIFCICSMH